MLWLVWPLDQSVGFSVCPCSVLLQMCLSLCIGAQYTKLLLGFLSLSVDLSFSLVALVRLAGAHGLS